MKRITIQLTEDQARQLHYVLSVPNWVQDWNNEGKNSPQNRFWQRIADKIKLAQAKTLEQ